MREHGTNSMYQYGKCRCDLCKAANKAYREERRKKKLDPDDPRHGTSNGYTNLGCRCALCTKAITDQTRENRKRGLPEGDPRHGTVGGYTNWGCTCRECTSAASSTFTNSRYGLTAEQWQEKFNKQGRKCASCGAPEVVDGRRFHTDHNHDTGEVRDILCHGCNVALGSLKEDRTRILALADYLEKWSS